MSTVDYGRLQLTSGTPQGSRARRLAAALGVERRALNLIFSRAHFDLRALRSLTLTDLLALPVRPRDAERIFYLVQWERLQAHLELHGELPGRDELGPLLATLTPIFERHFSRGARLNETLIAHYRAELGQGAEYPPTGPSKRFLRQVFLWLGLFG